MARTSASRLFVSALPGNLTVLIGSFAYSAITGNWWVFGSGLGLVCLVLILRRFSFGERGGNPARWTRRELLDAYRGLLIDLDGMQSSLNALRASLASCREESPENNLRDEVLTEVRNSLMHYDATRDAQATLESLRAALLAINSHGNQQ